MKQITRLKKSSMYLNAVVPINLKMEEELTNPDKVTYNMSIRNITELYKKIPVTIYREEKLHNG